MSINTPRLSVSARKMRLASSMLVYRIIPEKLLVIRKKIVFTLITIPSAAKKSGQYTYSQSKFSLSRYDSRRESTHSVISICRIVHLGIALTRLSRFKYFIAAEIKRLHQFSLAA
jgi:hypothetical protein